MKLHDIVLIPGAGIGPEVTTATQRILAAAQAPLRWIEHRAGLAAIEAGLDVLPQATLDAIVAHGVALKGPCTTPVGEGFSSVNVQLRKRLNLMPPCARCAASRGVATLSPASAGDRARTPRASTAAPRIASPTRRHQHEGCDADRVRAHRPMVGTPCSGSGALPPQTQHHEVDRWPFPRPPSHNRGVRRVRLSGVDHRCRLHEAGGIPSQFDVLLLENLTTATSAIFVPASSAARHGSGANLATITPSSGGSAPDIAGKGVVTRWRWWCLQ
jgi:hypothetical protein